LLNNSGRRRKLSRQSSSRSAPLRLAITLIQALNFFVYIKLKMIDLPEGFS